MVTSMLNPTAPAWTPDRSFQHRDSNSTSPMTPRTPLSFNATAFVPQQVKQHFRPVNGYYPNDAQYSGYYPYMHYYNGYNMAYPSDAHGYTQKGDAEYSALEHYVSQEHPLHAYAPYQGHSNIATGWSSSGGDTGAPQSEAHDTFGSQFHQVDNLCAADWAARNGFNGWHNGNGNGVKGWYNSNCNGFNGWHSSNGNGNSNGNAGAGVDVNGGETKRTKNNKKKKNKKNKGRTTRKDSTQDTGDDGNKATSGQEQDDNNSDSEYQLVRPPAGETMVEVE
ncbi:hypothetical protein BKA63DRAFT_569868 [Paraphoma chrysanthemicola]|nr:hypothetical protein BKA63DRAFT_569868 [Paraphoma chrysanthemicola]